MDNRDVENGDNDAGSGNVHACAARVRAQEFFTNDPELWFFLLESQFAVSKLTADNTKYHTVVAQLSQTVADRIKDLLRNPPETGKYDALKARLIREFTPSEQTKIKKLLSNMELGDKKPSYLLQEMRSLAGNAIDSSFLKTLWIDRMPTTLQQILSAWEDEDLEKLSQMADRVVESTNVSFVSTIAAPSRIGAEPTRDDTVTRLITQMEKLCHRIEQLEKSRQRGTTPPRRSRHPTPSRELSNTQPSQPPGDSGNEICWYHRKHGDNAAKCRKPCAFMIQKN